MIFYRYSVGSNFGCRLYDSLPACLLLNFTSVESFISHADAPAIPAGILRTSYPFADIVVSLTASLVSTRQAHSIHAEACLRRRSAGGRPATWLLLASKTRGSSLDVCACRQGSE